MKPMENKSWKELLSEQEITPRPKLWDNLEATIQKRNALFHRRRYLSAAAILMVLFSSGYLLNLQLSQQTNTKLISQNTPEIKELRLPRVQKSLIPSFQQLVLSSKQRIAELNTKESIQGAQFSVNSMYKIFKGNVVSNSNPPITETAVIQNETNSENNSDSTQNTPPIQKPALLVVNKEKLESEKSRRKDLDAKDMDWVFVEAKSSAKSNWIISSNLSIPDKGSFSSSNSIKTGITTSNTDGTSGLVENSSLREYTYTSRIQTEIIATRRIYKGLSFITGLRYFLENGNHEQENRTGDITNSQSIGDYHYQQISIPVGLRYELFSKLKFNSYLQSSYSFSASQSYSQELVRQDLSKLYSKEHFSIGIGLEYKVFNWIGIFAQPSFIQGMSHKDDQRTSLKTGLNIHF